MPCVHACLVCVCLVCMHGLCVPCVHAWFVTSALCACMVCVCFVCMHACIVSALYSKFAVVCVDFRELVRYIRVRLCSICECGARIARAYEVPAHYGLCVRLLHVCVQRNREHTTSRTHTHLFMLPVRVCARHNNAIVPSNAAQWHAHVLQPRGWRTGVPRRSKSAGVFLNARSSAAPSPPFLQ